jgi:hypothetical protein
MQNCSTLSIVRASKAKAKIQTLQNQLVAGSNLQNSALLSPDSLVSSAEAIRLLNRFNFNWNVDTSTNSQAFTEQREIEVLQGMEVEFTATQNEFKEATRALQVAQRQVSEATQAEQLAQKRLLQAQQELANAQAYYYDAQQNEFQAVQVEQNAAVKEEEQAWQLQEQAARVTYVLKQVEKRSKQQLAAQMERDIQSLQATADEWDLASLRIKRRVNQMKQKLAKEE